MQENSAIGTIENERTGSTTLEQRRALIAAYQRTRNMSAAMREVGIRSPRTGYLWLRRFEEGGDAGLALRSRARKTQRRVSADIEARAIELKREQPDWGRRRIAREIQSQHGCNAVSPAGVEAVLRRNELWKPVPRAEAAPVGVAAALPLRSDHAELDALLPAIVEGIEASLSSRAAFSVALLGDSVWRRLGADSYTWSRFLGDPAIGPLLLRSRIELGRSLMNTGQWRESAQMLEETLGWLRRAVPEMHEPSGVDPRLGISLRRSDIWIEIYQYLGIVLRNRAPADARSYLRIALDTLRSPSKRLVPLHSQLVEGNLERDLAKHLLRHEESTDAEIAEHLHRSRSILETVGDRAMLAATDMGWADLHSRRAIRLRDEDRKGWASALEAMDAALERALAVFETLSSPMLHANFLADAARLSVRHRLGLNHLRVRQAAQYCLVFGYGGQAHQLANLPGIDQVLSAEMLQELSFTEHGADFGPRRSRQSRLESG